MSRNSTTQQDATLVFPRSSDASQGLVLTLSDFNELGASGQAWQSAALADAMSRGPLVLAGTTYRDADIRQWVHSIAGQLEGSEPAVYALIAREGLGLARQQFGHVTRAVREQWEAVGVKAVLVQDHADAAQVLLELTTMGDLGYRTPQERARAFRLRLLGDFRSLQDQHSQQLDADRQALPTSTDTDLTLWLSDGSDELVRWASHDRTYRHPDKLRRVPLGHDSPWIGARCVSSNEVLVESLEGGSQAPRRWRTVVAGPVTMSLPGGPHLVCGALTAATEANLTPDEELEWRTAVADLVETWAERLQQRDT